MGSLLVAATDNTEGTFKQKHKAPEETSTFAADALPET